MRRRKRGIERLKARRKRRRILRVCEFRVDELYNFGLFRENEMSKWRRE